MDGYLGIWRGKPDHGPLVANQCNKWSGRNLALGQAQVTYSLYICILWSLRPARRINLLPDRAKRSLASAVRSMASSSHGACQGGYTEDDWLELIRRFHAGEGSERANCRELGINRSTWTTAKKDGTSPMLTTLHLPLP